MAAPHQLHSPAFRQSVRLLAVCTCTTTLLGCSPQQPRPTTTGPSERDLRGIAAAERSVQPQGNPRPASEAPEKRVAMAAGTPVTWEDLRPALAEAAGAQALQELTLDRMLDLEMRNRGMTITADDIGRERTLIEETISREASVGEDDTERLLASVRRNRGLGPTRFQQLLERTARMRKLVATDIHIEEAELRQAFEMRYGVRYRARAIVTSQDREAIQIHSELQQAPVEHRALLFADRAVRSSIDPSADRGGLLETFSPLDPAYPGSIRAAAQRLSPGEMSPVIAVDRGFAILLLEEIIPADPTVHFDQVAAAIERDVRLRRERLAMDDLARRLLHRANITVFDRSLAWSWQNALPAQPARP